MASYIVFIWTPVPACVLCGSCMQPGAWQALSLASCQAWHALILTPCGLMQSSSMPGADRLAVATHEHNSGKCCRDEYFGLRVRLKDDPAQAINIPVNSTVGPSGTGNPGLSPPWVGHRCTTLAVEPLKRSQHLVFG